MFYKRIFISLIAIFLSILGLFLIQNFKERIPREGYFILSPLLSISLSLGIISGIYAIVKIAKTRRAEISEVSVEKRLEEKTKEIYEIELEGRLLFEAGALASYLKRRGTTISKVDESGIYADYENWLKGLKMRIRSIERYNPKILENTYTFKDLLMLPLVYVDKVLEVLSSFYERCKRAGLNYLPRKAIRRFSAILKKYVRS